MMPQLFLIAADFSGTRPLVQALDSAGYRIRLQHSPTESEVAPDLVVLSLQTSSTEQITKCRQIPSFECKPLLVWLEHPGDVAAVLRAGADDCVLGAADFNEVLARIESLLRRAGQEGRNRLLVVGSVRVDLRRGCADMGKGPVSLTPKELHLFSYLVTREGTVVCRDELLREVWGYAATDTRTVDTHMAALRRKLETNSRRPAHLFTIRGHGYQFRA
jgi:two-component system, OmpR family, response regulator RegX3